MHLFEASAIDCKYTKMAGLQDFYWASSFTNPFQKQPLEVLCKKRGFQTFAKFHRKTPVLEFRPLDYNFIKKRLQPRCFPVKFSKFLRTTILRNICERLLLSFLEFKQLNHNVFLWLSWRHRFMYNKHNKLLRAHASINNLNIKTAFKHLNCYMVLKVIH